MTPGEIISRGLYFIELTIEEYFEVQNVTIRITTFKIRNSRCKVFIIYGTKTVKYE